MNALPNGTVTFLFTDIEGSTKLARQYPEELPALILRHNEILHQAIDAYHGYVFQTTGDSFAIAFHSAEDALNSALKAQRLLQSEVWSPAPIKIRMGIHTGTSQLIESSELRYSGYTAIAMTQRIMSAGHGGQILISQIVQELLRDKLPDSVTLRDMGRHRLKDVVSLEQLFQVNVPDLPAEFPALKTLSIQLNNLPAQLTHFVGRDREIAAVLRLLRSPEVHLVTLTGAGGTGKTRLSMQVAADLLDEYEHGVWFVELASITDPKLFVSTVASTLRVKEEMGKSIADALNSYLADKQLLLVLDNFEQIVNAAPEISGILNAAPKVKVLVSSREILRLRGEHDYPVPPLGLPESKRRQTAAVLSQYEAIALFTQHARAVNPHFEFNEDNANIIAEICMKLDGLPLAIELAAARSRLLKPAAMLEKLKNKLDTLTGGARDLPRRQQTIRGAIDWSYDLLDEAEKKLFARLGIFVGGWTLESAEAVCGSGLDALTGIESLLDKSLIRQHERTSGETRFAMLETIREYAHEKLLQGGELDAIQQEHADHMEQFLQKVADAQTKPEEAIWFSKLDDDFDNLRSVIEWALTQRKPAYALVLGQLGQYWNTRNKIQEPLGWLERALVMDGGSPRERAGALNSAGNLLVELGEFQKARPFYEDSLVLWREIGDINGIARGLNNLGNLAWLQEKDYAKAQKLFEEVLTIGREPNSFGHAMTLNNLGSLAKLRGDYAAALEYYTQSRQINVKIGSETGISYADWFLGRLALAQRKFDEARIHFENQEKASWLKASPLILRWVVGYIGFVELLRGNYPMAKRILPDAIAAALEHYLQTPNLSDVWMFLEAQARLDLLDGNFARSAQLFGSALKERETSEAEGENPLTEFERPEFEERLAELRAALGDAAFEVAFQKGQAMSRKDALLLASENING